MVLDQTPALAGTELASPAKPRIPVRTYLVFVKPHIDLTFILVALTGALLGWVRSGPFPLMPVLAVAGAVAFLSAGAECWTNILDRDMDALMPRTAKRPLPSGKIPLQNATVLAAVLTAAGLLLAAALGPIPFLFLAFALINNVVVYSVLTKRSTPWSIVLGAGVGPLTLWAGYAAVHEPISAAAWLLGAMVAVWVPVHIWAIAVRYRADYARGNVPMAPVVWPPVQLAVASFLSTAVMGALAVVSLVFLGGPAARWLVVPIGALSFLLATGAVLLPWHQRLAMPFIRVVTIYLVLVLLSAIGCAV
jgi:protoheme IX farnesyltransferase